MAAKQLVLEVPQQPCEVVRHGSLHTVTPEQEGYNLFGCVSDHELRKYHFQRLFVCVLDSRHATAATERFFVAQESAAVGPSLRFPRQMSSKIPQTFFPAFIDTIASPQQGGTIVYGYFLDSAFKVESYPFHQLPPDISRLQATWNELMLAIV